MPHKDPEKRREAWRKWYRNNSKHAKQYYREKAKRNKERARHWFKKYKQSVSCNACGENHPACIDFHHTSPENKRSGISVMVQTGRSIASIKKEIAKCQVLCSNCHRKEHYSDD